MSQPSLQVKRVDHVYNMMTRMWTYEDTKVLVEPQILRGGKMSDGSDAWQSYCFVVVRKIPPGNSSPGTEPTVSLTIKSPYLVAACKNVIGDVPTMSWTVDPLELSTDLLIAFFSRFVAYRDELESKADRSSEEGNILDDLQLLIGYLREDHQNTISQIDNLLEHGEITYDLLYAILIPGTRLASTDSSTGEPCALKLNSCARGPMFHVLSCTGVDVLDMPQPQVLFGDNVAGTPSQTAQAAKPPRFGKVQRPLNLARFEGVIKINMLPVYPMKYHSDEAGLKEVLLARAHRWMTLNGVHHVHYQGTAVSAANSPMGKTYIKYEVHRLLLNLDYSIDRNIDKIDSRIMIDRGTFKHHNANYQIPQAQPLNDTAQQGFYPPPVAQTDTLHVMNAPEKHRVELSDDDLILASPVLYGFSLSDKLWLEFNVEKVRPIVWSDEPFTNLVLPGNRRDLLRSLVEAHNSNLDFDDFVHGKGQGLVINLFGPLDEHLKRPLYMIGGGELGADANTVDTTLKRVFSIAASWSAIVLIDEADVFLEQRSLHDLTRNAMVAVFLRHVEYYRGILFLTTNRVKAFDPAFLSRIHVALRFQELSKEAKLQIWHAFLQKVKVDDLTADELDNLVSREVNGRQIKNATRTAISLARSRGEQLGYKHLAETLDAMEEFASS
ncbi:uncharacterized protein B0H18DRAFT_1208889 [Fomitopsis serialis]|uniref:uncharacterized protein n=1 Tax=Fomitopsis serialis TaxID=139415 RepID=UPI0020076EAB|nr:uncharacterized protein B0H18DRAFT_1208889 [Neoantrodia serialis]KAH9931582.1 hypothetical protein B0H18DRAFT_1208889 [Neoantrodia serialis]